MSRDQSTPVPATALPSSVAATTTSLVRLRYSARDLSLFPRLPAHMITGGGHQSRFRGRGMDFDEVRPYQAGDDIRTIDWRVTARTSQTHTKIFREERERPVILVTDLRQTMFFGSQQTKSVCASEIAATMAWAGFYAGDRVGGLIFAPDQQQDIRARRSHHSVLRLIQMLSETSISLAQRRRDIYSLTQILEHARRVALPGATVILISDFYDFDRAGEQQLFELARHCDLTLCHVFDSLETSLPSPGLYPVSHDGRRFTLNTANSANRKIFESAKQKQFERLQQSAQRVRAGYLQICTGSSVASLLKNIYGNKGRRRRGR
jgi:uncharacterized protein (DUF58 family)